METDNSLGRLKDRDSNSVLPPPPQHASALSAKKTKTPGRKVRKLTVRKACLPRDGDGDDGDDDGENGFDDDF